MTEANLRQILKDSGIKLLEKNLVQGTWGNSSIRLDENRMLVTPSGIDYVALKPEDMAIVDINTMEWTGNMKPTSEKGIHAAIYRERPEINAVIHTHPVYCSILASARVPLPVMSERMLHLIGGDVRVAGYGLPGTKKLKQNTVIGMKDRKAALMANHGVLCAGVDMDEAFEIMAVMEESSRLFIEKSTCAKTGNCDYSDELLHNYYLESKK